MKPDHPVSECPFLLYSANVANTEEQFTSYADAAKDRSTTTATVRPSGKESASGSKEKPGSSGEGQSSAQSAETTDASGKASERNRKRVKEESPADDPEKSLDPS